jgi:hypothetical protein
MNNDLGSKKENGRGLILGPISLEGLIKTPKTQGQKDLFADCFLHPGALKIQKGSIIHSTVTFDNLVESAETMNC